MSLGDRSVCGEVEPYAQDLLPITVQRLVDGPAAAQDRPAYTIVAGMAPMDAP